MKFVFQGCDRMVQPSPSVSGKFRVLEVNLQSAYLNSKKITKTYVDAYICPEAKIQTKVNSTRGSNPIWDEKFVFSISDNSSMLCEIYQARRWRKDSFIGKAKCDLHSLFESIKIKEEECKYDTGDEDSCYDTADEDPWSYNIDDGTSESNDHSNSDGIDEEEESAEQKVSTSLKVFKGSKNVGILNIELALKGYISCVGNSKCPNMAMAYDDFMAYQSGNVNTKKKHQSWLCFTAE